MSTDTITYPDSLDAAVAKLRALGYGGKKLFTIVSRLVAGWTPDRLARAKLIDPDHAAALNLTLPVRMRAKASAGPAEVF